MHRRFLLAIATVLLAFSPAMWALGLGQAKILSYLNQPLMVRIDLITRPSDDIAAISAKLASAADFAMVGASLAAISVPLDFSIQEQNGEHFIMMTSRVAVTDPVVRVIVEVNWSNGRMLREYTLLLDPPTFESAASAPSVKRSDVNRERARPAAVQELEPKVESAPSQPRVSEMPADGEYGPVQSGDTLWRIASDWTQGTDMDVNQVMLAIQQINPDAFLNNNINLLCRGVTLQMPAVGDIRRISESEARAEVLAQSSEFLQRSDAVAEDLPLLADASEQAEESASIADAGDDDRLELMPPQSRSLADNDGAVAEARADSSPDGLREELARTEEQLISEQQQNEYLRQRIGELEGDLSDSTVASASGERPGQTEGAVVDADLSAMEERLAQERSEAGRIPSVQTGADDSKSSPWYSSWLLWMGVLLAAGLAAAGWYFRRRDSDAVYVSDLGREEESVQDIVEEAEDIQQALDSGVEPGDDNGALTVDDSAESITGDEDQSDAEASASDMESLDAAKPASADEDATILDEESADPEIKLELARAYISMGDKEAARAILGEVIEHGDEEQQEEAQKMHDTL